MDEILTHYGSTIFLSISCFVVTFVIRRFVEGWRPLLRKDTPTTKMQYVWEGVVLPTLPIAVGGVLAYFAPDMVHPDVTSVRTQVLYGCVCGFFSTWAYQVIKAFITKILPGVKEPTGREGDSWMPKRASTVHPESTAKELIEPKTQDPL